MSWPPPNYRPAFGTGYRVTFDDFRNLLAYPSYRSSIGALLREWYGYEIVAVESDAVVRSPTGDVVDLRALHEAIQSDPQKQYDLYQRAMTLWR
jgi:hypothetical protein